MHVPFGNLILTLAQLALTGLIVAGALRRELWARVSAILVGASFIVFCQAVRELLNHTAAAEALLWARLILGLGIVLVLASHIFALTLGRADPAGSVRSGRTLLLVQGTLGVAFLFWLGQGSFVHDVTFSEGSWTLRLGGVGRIYLGFLLFCLAGVAFRLECTCRAVSGAARRQVLWAALGIFGAAGYFSYLLTDGAVSGIIERDALVAAGVPLLLAVLLSLAQVVGGAASEVSIGRQVIYKSLTGWVAGGYVVIVLAAGYLAQLVGLRPAHLAAGTLFVTSSAWLVMFLFSRRLRRRMLRFLDRHLAPERVDYRTYWLRASHDLISGAGAPALQDRGTILFEDLFESSPVTLHLARRPGEPFRVMRTTAASEPPDVELHDPIVRRMEANPEPFLVPDRSERHARGADPALLPVYVESEILLETTGARVIAPLRTVERLIGFISLGPRRNGDRYSYEDLALLETITLQLAGALRGAWLAEDLGTAREMEVFSQWASVVVHDLKNFVSPLKLFLQNARRHMHNPEFREQAIDDIQAVVEKMDSEIQRLTALRHGEEISPTPTDLHWIIDSVIARSGIEVRSGFSLDRRFARLPDVMADAVQLDRVFSNLVTNAIEAMPNGGALTIETSDLKDDGTGNRWAVVRVRDTGAGMAPAFMRNRLFQPFATTKKKGWGMGLYQCRQIVEAHGGTLTATSQEGIGSEFKVTLPLRHAARHTSERVGPGAVAPGPPARQS